jgi:hypothetical protein
MAIITQDIINNLTHIPEETCYSTLRLMCSEDISELKFIPFAQICAVFHIYKKNVNFPESVVLWLHEQCKDAQKNTISEQISTAEATSKVFSDYLVKRAYTPLEQAVIAGSLQDIFNQIQYVNPHARNCLGQNAMHLACEHGRLEVVIFLAKHYGMLSGMDFKDVKGFTPFEYACIHGHKDIVEWILDQRKSSTFTYLEQKNFLKTIKIKNTMLTDEIPYIISLRYLQESEKLFYPAEIFQQIFPTFNHKFDHILHMLKCSHNSILPYMAWGDDLFTPWSTEAYAIFSIAQVNLLISITSDEFLSNVINSFKTRDISQMDSSELSLIQGKMQDIIALLTSFEKSISMCHPIQIENFLNNCEKLRTVILPNLSKELGDLINQCTTFITIRQQEEINSNPMDSKKRGMNFTNENCNNFRQRFDDNDNNNMMM